MSDERSRLEEMIDQLKQERDELRLQLHLAGMEAKEEYSRLSGQVEELGRQFEPVGEAFEQTAKNLLAALGLAADELKHGFHRVRKAIGESRKEEGR